MWNPFLCHVVRPSCLVGINDDMIHFAGEKFIAKPIDKRKKKKQKRDEFKALGWGRFLTRIFQC